MSSWSLAASGTQVVTLPDRAEAVGGKEFSWIFYCRFPVCSVIRERWKLREQKWSRTAAHLSNRQLLTSDHVRATSAPYPTAHRHVIILPDRASEYKSYEIHYVPFRFSMNNAKSGNTFRFISLTFCGLLIIVCCRFRLKYSSYIKRLLTACKYLLMSCVKPRTEGEKHL